ncbi:MAG TPA: CYTH and CHAD domain-containing protein [Trebonia sp.]|jgi:CHAD domain-containing protein|nr:CYTH and CHAD domain-containing protein [Trebonia sp.]
MTTDIAQRGRLYEAEPGTPLPPLDELPHVATVSAPAAATIITEYYDTDDLRLLKARIKLRRMADGPDESWLLRFPDSRKRTYPGAQRELRTPLGQPGDNVPEELARLLRAYTRGGSLRPVARIETRRNRTTLLDSAGTPLAEVLADEVSAQTLGRSTTLTQWHEVEVDLECGSRRLLRAADELLRRGGLRPASQYGELERALAGDLPRQRAGQDLEPGRQASAGTVVVGYAAGQAAKLMALDAAVRADEPDSVHQMRVTTRRLRSTLQAFPQVLAKRETRHRRDELKWLSGVLGAARDAEVLSDYLETRAGGLPAELVIGPAQARLQAHFAPVRAGARAAVSDVLESRRYFELLDDLDRLLDDPPLTPEAAAPAAEVLPAALGKAYRRTRRRMRTALGTPAGPARDVALHEARKAAKRARYAAEAVRPAFGKDARRFAKRMKAVQSVLGGHQDSVSARTVAREIGVRANLAGESSFTFGILHRLVHQEGLDSQHEARRAWRRAKRGKTRKRLSHRA